MHALLALALLVCPSLQAENPNLFIKPIMYGTAIALLFIGYFILYWMYGMNYEKDPMIYSKFLSVKKNK